jgi:hypothetical protein
MEKYAMLNRMKKKKKQADGQTNKHLIVLMSFGLYHFPEQMK